MTYILHVLCPELGVGLNFYKHIFPKLEQN